MACLRLDPKPSSPSPAFDRKGQGRGDSTWLDRGWIQYPGPAEHPGSRLRRRGGTSGLSAASPDPEPKALWHPAERINTGTRTTRPEAHQRRPDCLRRRSTEGDPQESTELPGREAYQVPFPGLFSLLFLGPSSSTLSIFFSPQALRSRWPQNQDQSKTITVRSPRPDPPAYGGSLGRTGHPFPRRGTDQSRRDPTRPTEQERARRSYGPTTRNPTTPCGKINIQEKRGGGCNDPIGLQ